MGSGSGGGSQTVTNRTEIDPVTQAWRAQIINTGGQLYNQGIPDYYPNSQVVPFSGQTQQGLNYLENYAQQGAPNLQASNDATSRALSGWNPAMPMAANAATGGLNNQQAGGLSQFGQGQNPHLQSLFNQGAEQIGNAVNANFAQAGRYGSDAHAAAQTRELGNLWTNINMPAYEAERNRGLTAAQSMAQVGDSNANRSLAGTELLGGLYSQGNQDASRAQVIMPQTYQYGMMPGQNMLDLGGMYENQQGAYLQDDINRYNYSANAPWDYLQRYQEVVNGLPDFSGQAQTSPAAARNRTMGAMGGAMSGATMGSQIYPGWGTAIGAVAGGLFGAYG